MATLSIIGYFGSAGRNRPCSCWSACAVVAVVLLWTEAARPGAVSVSAVSGVALPDLAQPAPGPHMCAESAASSPDAWREFPEGAEVVPPGAIQLELGYAFVYDRSGGERTRTHVAPDLRLRAGLFERYELRIGWEGYAWTKSLTEARSPAGRRVWREESEQGAADLTLGLKHKLCDQAGWQPNLAIVGQVTLPSGSAGVSSGDVDPDVTLHWAWELTDTLELAGSVSLHVPTEAAGRFVQTGASMSLTAALTDRVEACIEYQGEYPAARQARCAHYLIGGLTVLLTERLHLHVHAGPGLCHAADDLRAGVSVALRY